MRSAASRGSKASSEVPAHASTPSRSAASIRSADAATFASGSGPRAMRTGAGGRFAEVSAMGAQSGQIKTATAADSAADAPRSGAVR
ncbi:MAG: hypothetical protein QM820_49245 [Minicystis sp.]